MHPTTLHNLNSVKESKYEEEFKDKFKNNLNYNHPVNKNVI